MIYLSLSAIPCSPDNMKHIFCTPQSLRYIINIIRIRRKKSVYKYPVKGNAKLLVKPFILFVTFQTALTLRNHHVLFIATCHSPQCKTVIKITTGIANNKIKTILCNPNQILRHLRQIFSACHSISQTSHHIKPILISAPHL